MVLHLEACWGGLPTWVQKKNYNIETGKKVTYTRNFQKLRSTGGYFWRELSTGVTFGGKIKTNHLAGKFQKTFGRKKCKLDYGGNILAGALFSKIKKHVLLGIEVAESYVW